MIAVQTGFDLGPSAGFCLALMVGLSVHCRATIVGGTLLTANLDSGLDRCSALPLHANLRTHLHAALNLCLHHAAATTWLRQSRPCLVSGSIGSVAVASAGTAGR